MVLLMLGCKPYKVSDRDCDKPKIDTVYNGHYFAYSGRVYVVEYADIMCKYNHDRQLCEATPGTSCYKHKHYGKSESNR